MTNRPAQRAYQVVLEAIEEDLRSGKLSLGDQLPGERALAEKHGISRASVRDAIRILDVMGVVRTSTGSGPNSGAVIISEPAAGISQALRLHVAAKGITVEEMVSSRVLLETWAARSARPDEQYSAEVLASTEELLERMEDPQLSREEFHRLDAEFHILLTSMAGNAVVEAFMQSLRHSISDYVSAAFQEEDSWQPTVKVLRKQHRQIHEAFAADDGERAAVLLEEHINWFYSQFY